MEEDPADGPRQPSPSDIADYAGEMAAELAVMCEGVGLPGLAAIFYAAMHEARRVEAREQAQAPKAAPGNAA